MGHFEVQPETLTALASDLKSVGQHVSSARQGLEDGANALLGGLAGFAPQYQITQLTSTVPNSWGQEHSQNFIFATRPAAAVPDHARTPDAMVPLIRLEALRA